MKNAYWSSYRFSSQDEIKSGTTFQEIKGDLVRPKLKKKGLKGKKLTGSHTQRSIIKTPFLKPVDRAEIQMFLEEADIVSEPEFKSIPSQLQL